MCRVSDQLQLCSCKLSEISKTHFWVLHRLVEGKDEFNLGVCLPPASIDEELNTLNEQTLLQMLNERNVFDQNITLKENDLLQLSFRIASQDDSLLSYGFMYQNGKWSSKPYEVFDWMSHHETFSIGKIVKGVEETDSLNQA